MDLLNKAEAYSEPLESLHGGSDRLLPILDQRERDHADHFVQFYESDDSLVDSVSGFIGDGLEAEEGCIVIATRAHREGLEQKLRARGLDVAAARAQGQYVALDAAETLSMFLCEGTPERRRFLEVVGRVVAQAAEGGRRVRAFGEMVALLCLEGNQEAAIRLEELWNELGKTYAFSLFCAYSIDSFGGEAYAAPFAQICAQHSRVLPAESYAALRSPEDQLRAITLLQQKAKSLEAEIAHRKAVEKSLAARERELSDFFENANEGLHKVGPDGIILWANRAELDLLGNQPDEYIGHPVAEFHADRDVIADILARLLRGEDLYNCPARLRCKDGSIKHVLIHSNAYFEDGKFVHTRCFTRDVTERTQMEAALQARLSEIESLNDRLQRSMTETHHRVKNNLQIIAAMIEMQAVEHEGEQAIPLEEFSRLKSHVCALAMVHDLLTSSVKETETTQHISIKAVLDRLLPMLQQIAWKQTVRFAIADAPVLSKQCISLALVLNELVSNALKHGRSEAEVTFAVHGQEAVLEVCDDGPGFPQGFDAFTCANTGLELVESLVRTDLAGHVTYENRPQGGAKVHVVFTLPAQDK